MTRTIDAVLAFGAIVLICLAASWTPSDAPTAIPAAPMSSMAASGNPSVHRGAPYVEVRQAPGAAGVPPVPAAPTGYAGWASASLGANYLAMRLPRGTRVTLCAKACWTGIVTDYGPSSTIHPVRVADIAVGHWVTVCGLGPVYGLCEVSVTVAGATPTAPATDVDG